MTEYTLYRVQAKQSIYDVAIQCYGTAEAVAVILEDNAGITINDNLEGLFLNIRQNLSDLSGDITVAKFFRDNQKEVNNEGLEEEFSFGWLTEDDEPWIDGEDNVLLY